MKRVGSATGGRTVLSSVAVAAAVAGKCWVPRNGLGESLESYADRNGSTPVQALYVWRVFGLERLAVPVEAMANDDLTSCRTAPGLSVPTRAAAYDERGPVSL